MSQKRQSDVGRHKKLIEHRANSSNVAESNSGVVEKIGSEEPQEVRERILDVATHLFIDNGYKGTSVRDIAAKSETNVAMVNYYFRSKYNLFEMVFEKTLNAVWGKILISFHEDKDVLTFIRDWIDTYYEVLIEYPKLPIFLLNEVSVNPERLTNNIRGLQPKELFVMLSRRIEDEAKQGNIRYIPPLDLMLNVMSMCIFPFIMRNLAQHVAGVSNTVYEEMVKEHRKHVIDFTMNALKPDRDR